jgi:hypothetical protein
MWTDADIDRWVTALFDARERPYREARTLLLTIRNEIGEATVTEAQRQKRARYLARRAARRTASKEQ